MTQADKTTIEPMDIEVQILEGVNEAGKPGSHLRITNKGEQALGTGWRLYSSLGLTLADGEQRLERALVEGRYGYVSPTAQWTPLSTGKSIEIPIKNWLFTGMALGANQGFFLTETVPGQNEELLLGAPAQKKPVLIDLPESPNRLMADSSPRTDLSYLTPGHVFDVNEDALNNARDKDKQPQLVIPSVKQCELQPGSFALDSVTIVAEEGLETERDQLVRIVEETTQISPAANGLPIHLRIGSGLDREAYKIAISTTAVTITGGHASGVFWGIQSFRQLASQDPARLQVRCCNIEDSPDFTHRAFFLDIARHFQGVEQICKTIEVMSAYKMNRIQLGISNDEGWRLEIPGLPELTDIGSRRSYNVEDGHGQRQALYPAWGDDHRCVEGFLSSDDMVQILQFAADHHVEVILEFNLPGHANALIRSLEGHPDYALLDPDDTSVYRSAQGFTQNVVNVCLDSTYELAYRILTEIRRYYEQTGLPFTRIHFGGDEVPAGAWLNSPVVRASPLWDKNWSMENADDRKIATEVFMTEHYRRVTAVAEQVSPGLVTGFWHEMSPCAPDSNNNPRRYFNGWTTEAADRNIINSMLDQGQNMVISNASYLYLDMPYGFHQDEPGLPWAAYIDTRLIYGFDPLAAWDIGVDKAGFVLGLQAQLWGETVYSPELADFYTFPRLLAVAERSWNRSPNITNWTRFALAIGQREQGFLENRDVYWRIPSPGIRLRADQLHANVEFPGLLIRYTTDGSDPDLADTLYEQPIRVDHQSGITEVRMASFTLTGRMSRVVSQVLNIAS